jgi:hypothetical protein
MVLLLGRRYFVENFNRVITNPKTPKIMKRSLKALVKGLIVIVLFTGSAITLSTAGVETVAEAKAAVSSQQVYQYLTSRGYQVGNMAETPDKVNEDWICQTSLQGVRYQTTVKVSGTQIVGTVDVPM